MFSAILTTDVCKFTIEHDTFEQALKHLNDALNNDSDHIVKGAFIYKRKDLTIKEPGIMIVSLRTVK